MVSSTRCVARFHWVLHPDRHVGRRLHFLRNGFWSTSLPGIHGTNLFNDVLLVICALSNSRWFVFGEMLWRREQALWITSYPYIELQKIQTLDWSPKTGTLSIMFCHQNLENTERFIWSTRTNPYNHTRLHLACLATCVFITSPPARASLSVPW